MQEKPLRIPNKKKVSGVVANFKDIELAMAMAVFRQEQKREAEKVAVKQLPGGML